MSIPWTAVEGLFLALEAEITEGSGSRVRIALNEVRSVFYRPHPEKEVDKGAVKSIGRFLIEAGINSDEI
ncbi:MAG: type II toxin-antitoxin system HicA family toxin [Cuspidothrix sp.]